MRPRNNVIWHWVFPRGHFEHLSILFEIFPWMPTTGKFIEIFFLALLCLLILCLLRQTGCTECQATDPYVIDSDTTHLCSYISSQIHYKECLPSTISVFFPTQTYLTLHYALSALCSSCAPFVGRDRKRNIFPASPTLNKNIIMMLAIESNT